MTSGIDIIAIVTAVGAIFISLFSKIKKCNSCCCESDCTKDPQAEVKTDEMEMAEIRNTLKAISTTIMPKVEE